MEGWAARDKYSNTKALWKKGKRVLPRTVKGTIGNAGNQTINEAM